MPEEKMRFCIRCGTHTPIKNEELCIECKEIDADVSRDKDTIDMFTGKTEREDGSGDKKK